MARGAILDKARMHQRAILSVVSAGWTKGPFYSGQTQLIRHSLLQTKIAQSNLALENVYLDGNLNGITKSTFSVSQKLVFSTRLLNSVVSFLGFSKSSLKLWL